MQELSRLIIEDFNNVFDEVENDLASINAKNEHDFILKHDNISDEYLNDFIKIHNELGYEQCKYKFNLDKHHFDLFT